MGSEEGTTTGQQIAIRNCHICLCTTGIAMQHAQNMNCHQDQIAAPTQGMMSTIGTTMMHMTFCK